MTAKMKWDNEPQRLTVEMLIELLQTYPKDREILIHLPYLDEETGEEMDSSEHLIGIRPFCGNSGFYPTEEECSCPLILYQGEMMMG